MSEAQQAIQLPEAFLAVNGTQYFSSIVKVTGGEEKLVESVQHSDNPDALSTALKRVAENTGLSVVRYQAPETGEGPRVPYAILAPEEL